MKRRPEGTEHKDFHLDIGLSDKWFHSFKDHHPELRWGTPQSIDARRITQSDEYTAMKYFNLLDN